jgi:hypothetical protein
MLFKDFYECGGWGMYPTTIFGVLLLAAGVAYAILPERRLMPLLVSMSVVTLGAGFLGCTTGFITTFRYIQKVPAVDQHAITLAGISESLNNVVLSFMFIVCATLIAAVGALRLGLRSKAQLDKPAPAAPKAAA